MILLDTDIITLGQLSDSPEGFASALAHTPIA